MSIVPGNIRMQPIAACLAAAFALAPPLALATTRVVNTCADDGVGSLRQQVSAANSGDTIDLSTAQLTCSLITLSVSEIATGVASLTLKGPASRTVTITTSDPIRLLHHTGAQTLKVSNLTLSGGRDDQNPDEAQGGCIASLGSVVLEYAVVSGCMAHSEYGRARGGAVYAPAVSLYHAVVSGNSASSVHNTAFGGGIYTHQLVIQSYSTLTANAATSAAESTYGGGAFATYSASLYFSTVDSNHARAGGGLYCGGGFGSSTILHDSTVSGNSADSFAGGIATAGALVKIYNSTIAFNSAQAMGGLFSNQSVQLNSSIVARNRNTSPGGFADLFVSQGDVDSAGLNNLIQSYNVVPATGVITFTSDPQLAPLAFRGGPTRTHALLATSPAVDHGNNEHSAGTDQRGSGFDRVVNGTQDIGAYERQIDDDEIFYGGFD